MTALNWRFETTFASLPEAFYAHVSPRALPSPALVIFNAALARELGLAEAQVAPEALAKACVGLDLPANTVTLAELVSQADSASVPALTSGGSSAAPA